MFHGVEDPDTKETSHRMNPTDHSCQGTKEWRVRVNIARRAEWVRKDLFLGLLAILVVERFRRI